MKPLIGLLMKESFEKISPAAFPADEKYLKFCKFIWLIYVKSLPHERLLFKKNPSIELLVVYHLTLNTNKKLVYDLKRIS